MEGEVIWRMIDEREAEERLGLTAEEQCVLVNTAAGILDGIVVSLVLYDSELCGMWKSGII